MTFPIGSVQPAPTPLMRLDLPEVFGGCSGPRGFPRPVTRPEIDDSNGAGWQLYSACRRSMLQYCFSRQRLVEHGDVLTVPSAKAAGPEPDEVLRDVLCQLIEKLRVEINVLSETDLRAGKDAKAGQRFSFVDDRLVTARMRMDRGVGIIRLKSRTQEVGPGHGIRLNADHHLAGNVHVDEQRMSPMVVGGGRRTNGSCRNPERALLLDVAENRASRGVTLERLKYAPPGGNRRPIGRRLRRNELGIIRREHQRYFLNQLVPTPWPRCTGAGRYGGGVWLGASCWQVGSKPRLSVLTPSRCVSRK
jgi:hypothetical protein